MDYAITGVGRQLMRMSAEIEMLSEQVQKLLAENEELKKGVNTPPQVSELEIE